MPLKKKEKIVVQSIGTMIALSDNNEVKVDLKNMKAEGKSTGLLKSVTNFLDAKQERKIHYEQFKDSMDKLKATRFDDSLKKEASNNPKAKGEQKSGQ